MIILTTVLGGGGGKAMEPPGGGHALLPLLFAPTQWELERTGQVSGTGGGVCASWQGHCM